MKKRNLLSTLIITAGLFAGSASASIVYQVDRIISKGSVSGTITTDGTIGNLSTTNCSFEAQQGSTCSPKSSIIDWNLLLSDGTDSFTLTGENSVLLSEGGPNTYGGTNFWATPDTLIYDYTAPGFALFDYGDWSSIGYTAPEWELGQFWESVYAGPNQDDDPFSERYYAQKQYASVPVPVPEPASLALLALGLVGIGCARTMKQR